MKYFFFVRCDLGKTSKLSNKFGGTFARKTFSAIWQFHFHSQTIKFEGCESELQTLNEKRSFHYQLQSIAVHSKYLCNKWSVFLWLIVDFIIIIYLCYLTIVYFQNKQLSYLIKSRKEGSYGLWHIHDYISNCSLLSFVFHDDISNRKSSPTQMVFFSDSKTLLTKHLLTSAYAKFVV